MRLPRLRLGLRRLLLAICRPLATEWLGLHGVTVFVWALGVPSLTLGILYADHALVALLVEYDWHSVNRESA